ncbi:NACHT domain-containing protein [Polyangium aurulentum]|uniref:NACHT domain-containing protein n=1 Tax=Polyangium aurulentum TaxID=2567896 RepID=UPI00197ECABD|nr:pentapeptide repeat-containing protein [Polyangium aurulentum]UQA57825.1 pentapeptide repeat-containing protein [Polyangium aurulentum]
MILGTLGKIFAAGALGYLGQAKQGFDETDVTAIASVIEAIGATHGVIKAKPETRIAALHSALVLQAFGTAFSEHWAGDECMAPGLDKGSWLHRAFRSGDKKAREEEIQTRLRLALGWLRPEMEAKNAAESLAEIHALRSDPMATPIYRALYTAFADGRFEEGEATALLDMRREGARLQFEGSFQMAYVALLATPAGQELGRYLIGLDEDRPRQLRRLLAEDLASSHHRHVFGAATPGVPMMPLGFMYVEPDGTWKEEEKEQRKPLRSLVRDLLGMHPIVLVRGDFGMGKSLTARLLANGWAREYVQNVEKTSPELVFPVFIKCARDFVHNSFDQTVREAFRNQADGVGISLLRSDEALAMPPSTIRVVYLVDGLDEVNLPHSELERLFQDLKGMTNDRHRVVVFSRKGALPPQEKLGGIPVIDVEPFRENQISVWLDRWNEVSGRDAITLADLQRARLAGLAVTPILLFMIAMTWDPTRMESGEASQVAIYEHFFQQIAGGKCKHDRDRHPRVAEASRTLKEKLVDLGHLGKEAPVEEAMLWLMSRISWEYRRCETRKESLDLQDVNNLLRTDLKLKGDPQTQEMIRMGALLVLQADLRDQNHAILFGHKSFREFLTARWWAYRLRTIIDEPSESRQKKLERDLHGAMLIDHDDRSFEFLMDILSGITWSDRERKQLAIWAERCFNDERATFDKKENEEELTWRDDQRPQLRHAALAIRCSLHGVTAFEVETLPLRSLLGWFWTRTEFSKLVAPRIVTSELILWTAELSQANLLGAILPQARLVAAYLWNASMKDADLRGANLQSANLALANLTGANLVFANLSSANLTGANLTGTNLRGADLRNAQLTSVDLRSALYDSSTLWPHDFNPNDAGAREVG